jgi:hypothetical protein
MNKDGLMVNSIKALAVISAVMSAVCFGFTLHFDRYGQAVLFAMLCFMNIHTYYSTDAALKLGGEKKDEDNET